MKIQTIDTVAEFLGLRKEWNALLECSVSNCVFLTHEWLSTWWMHLSEGRRLYILTLRDGGELIAVLPLTIRAPQYARMMPRSLEFIGSGIIGSDYLDAIVKRGCEQQAMALFADHLNHSGRMLHLSQLRGGAPLVELLAQRLVQNGWASERKKLNVCPHINLDGQTWDTYLATLGPNVRKNINRTLRNLPKSFRMHSDCVSAPQAAVRGVDIAMTLHHKRWEASGKSEAFQTKSVVAFHREFAQLAAEQGWMRVIVIYLDDVPASALYGFMYGQTFYFYQSGFDPAFGKHSVGVATMAMAIMTAIDQGASEFDFLHGDEEYKFHWASEVRDLNRIELHPPQASAWVYRHALGLNRAARRMARRVLNTARDHAPLNR
jgi:CelD/BcsL family acetyltransferase involved in cellulose biosynthesis